MAVRAEDRRADRGHARLKVDGGDDVDSALNTKIMIGPLRVRRETAPGGSVWTVSACARFPLMNCLIRW